MWGTATAAAAPPRPAEADGWGLYAEPPPKVGAGLLLRDEVSGECLLLLRRSRHNDNTWGLPGGNAEPGDGGDLHATALREALEELGSLPPMRVTGSFLTVRGKRLEKKYTVFVCAVSAADRAAWAPRLNYEHRAWHFFDAAALRAALGDERAAPPAPLHPVVEALLREHPAALDAADATRQPSR